MASPEHRRCLFGSRTDRDDAGGGRGGRVAPQERGRRRGRGDASRADQGRRKTGNRRMSRAQWPAPSVAAGRPGRERTTAALVMAAEAGARRRDVERDDGSAMVTARVPDDSSQTHGTLEIYQKPAF